MMRKVYTVRNPLGLHWGIAAKIVRLASSLPCGITLDTGAGGIATSATNITGILMLGAGRGSNVNVCVDGEDELEALEAVGALITSSPSFSEAVQPQPIPSMRKVRKIEALPAAGGSEPMRMKHSEGDSDR